MAETDFQNPFGGGGNEANNPSGSSFLQMQQMFSMMSSVFGFGNNRLNIWGPVGMNESQARMAPQMANLRSTLSRNFVGSSFDGIFGQGEFAKLGNLSQTIAGIGGSMLLNDPVFGKVASGLLGYNPERMGNLIDMQKSMFLRGRERMGTGTFAEQQERITRLGDTEVGALKSAIAISRSDDGRKAMGNVFSGRADDALELALRLQNGGVRGIFGEGYKGGINTDKYNKWVSAGASVGNALVTKDVGQIYSAMQQSGELDPTKTKETFDKIAKMAQYLNVSSEHMTKAVLEVQKTVKNQTGSNITIGRASDIVQTAMVQGQLAGFTPDQQMAHVGFQMQRESTARNSASSNALLAILDPNLMGMGKLSAEDQAKVLRGGAGDIYSIFKKSGLDPSLLTNQGYLQARRDQLKYSPEQQGVYEQALAAGIQVEASAIPRMRMAQHGMQTAANFYAKNGKYLNVADAKLTELKAMAAKGEISGADNGFVSRMIDKFQKEGMSSAEIMDRIGGLSGLSGTDDQTLQTELNSRVASKSAGQIEKYGGFENIVTKLRRSGGLTLTAEEQESLKNEYASGPGGRASALRKLQAGSKYLAGEDESFKRIVATEESSAMASANQARVTERSDAFIKKYGGGDAAKAVGLYMSVKALRDIGEGIDVNDEDQTMGDAQKASIKDALVASGMSEQEASAMLASGNKNTIKEALAGRVGSMAMDATGLEGAAAIASMGSYANEIAAQQSVKNQITEGTSGEGVAANEIPKDIPDLVADFVKALPKLTEGLGAFMEEIKTVFGELIKSVGGTATTEKGDTGETRGTGGVAQTIKVDVYDRRVAVNGTDHALSGEESSVRDLSRG